MSRLIDSTDDFKAYKKALGTAIKPGVTRNKKQHKEDVAESTRLRATMAVSGIIKVGDWALSSVKRFMDKLARRLGISGLFGFLVAWAALAIYGAIKIMEKIGWM